MKLFLRIVLVAAALLAGRRSSAAETVATVASEKIDSVEFSAKVAAEERNLGRRLNPEESRAVLQALVNQRLLVASAKGQGLLKKDEVKRTLDDYERQLLSNLVYEAEIGSKVQVSEAEVKAFFDGNKPLFDVRQVSQILIQPLSQDKVEAAKKEAERLKAKVMADPKSFADVAKAESDDGISKERGGDLGVLRRGMMLPEMEKAVFGAKAGSIVGPVQTQFGFHILQIRSARKQPYSEAKEVIARELSRARASELQQKLLDELGKKYKVTYKDKP